MALTDAKTTVTGSANLRPRHGRLGEPLVMRRARQEAELSSFGIPVCASPAMCSCRPATMRRRQRDTCIWLTPRSSPISRFSQAVDVTQEQQLAVVVVQHGEGAGEVGSVLRALELAVRARENGGEARTVVVHR
ncbi:hypothetical protein [Terrabacter sp. Root181]|uniref:hypothetical protein n=1 Tax=Terrabacter sp. Root181 TaxID=1736484 RepID=UPI0006F3CA43|nr:hypothetical protein [Terrabacter sp. Root181]KRB45067.1 hypothetical protein ASD90_15370 [Terrabacter sp. Root181]